MNRIVIATLLVGVFALSLGQARGRDKADPAEAKEALKALQEFIGEWNGVGGPDKLRADPRDSVWREKINWVWRFKGDEAWLAFEVKDGKHLKGGEVRYLPEKKKYQLTTIDKEGKRAAFEGAIKNEVLRVERIDPKTRETQRMELGTAAEGVRLIVRYGRIPAGSTLLRKEYMVAATREGESLGTAEKKNVCVVSGGVGTMPVAFGGETFYVCCSGCRDAFNENPAKYVKEFKAKKAGKN